MTDKQLTTLVAPDGTNLPIWYVDLKGDGTRYGLQTATVLVDKNGAPISSANPVYTAPASLALIGTGQQGGAGVGGIKQFANEWSARSGWRPTQGGYGCNSSRRQSLHRALAKRKFPQVLAGGVC